MDGIHDLGGRQGYGPVQADEKEEPFHAPWEGRMFAIARLMNRPEGWTIDKFRYTREQIEPADYLTRPYYDQWMQTYAAMLVEAGVATVEEIAAGRAETGPVNVAPAVAAADVPTVLGQCIRFDRDYAGSPRFAVGDAVRALSHGSPGHTRLPGYVRGRAGLVTHYRGAHLLPDEGAQGREHAEPLYTVVFTAAELWPDAEEARDRVHVDLWESYLEPA